MSNPDIQGGEYLKPETEEILKELSSEGHQIDGISSREEPKVETKVEPAKTEEPKTDEPKSEPQKVETEPEAPKADRKVQAVPVNKYNEERHKRQEAEKRAADLEEQLKGKSAEPVSTDAQGLATKWGLEPEFVSELLDTATKLTPKNTASLSPEEVTALKEAKAIIDQQKEEAAFKADFDSVAEKLSKEGFDITAHQKEIKQLAYTEGYTSTSLRAIALEYAHDNGLLTKGRKTLEKGSSGRTVTTEAIDFESLSEEQAKALPDEQWEKFVEHQMTKQKRAKGIVN